MQHDMVMAQLQAQAAAVAQEREALATQLMQADMLSSLSEQVSTRCSCALHTSKRHVVCWVRQTEHVLGCVWLLQVRGAAAATAEREGRALAALEKSTAERNAAAATRERLLAEREDKVGAVCEGQLQCRRQPLTLLLLLACMHAGGGTRA